VAVQRKVRIHRADPVPFDADRAMQLLRSAITAGTAEIPSGQGQSVVGSPLRRRPNDQGRHMVLYKIESGNTPFVYNRATGEMRPLEDILQAVPELAQPTYYGFFPDSTMAYVYNQVGPKEVQLAAYLFAIHQSLDYTFPPVARHDVLQAIAQSAGVRLFNIRVPTDQLARLNHIADLSALAVLAQSLPVGDVEIIVRARTDDQKRGLAGAVERIGRALGAGNTSEAVEKAKVQLAELDALSGDSALSLLEDKLVVSHVVDTVAGNARYLDEASAREAIEEAYRAVRGVV
jgi:hypothetical protein